MNQFLRGKRDPLFTILIGVIAVLTAVGAIATLVWVCMPKYSPADLPTPGDSTEKTPDTTDTTATDKPVIADTTTLAETPDAGQDYLDSIVFFGESTTTHWIHRGGLTGGRDTTQVWTTESGTFNLDGDTASSLLIRYPETGEMLTLAEAASRKKPAIMILTIGINGVTGFCRNEKTLNYYETYYQRVIDAIRGASPETKIIIQSTLPISSTSDAYLDVQTVIHKDIPMLNERAYALAVKNGLKYLDTGEILKNADGELAAVYDYGDGVHLTANAYEAMREYIRTHAWVD